MPVVTWEGLEAWCRQMGIHLEPWEAKAMVTLGVTRANVNAEKMDREMKQKPAKK